MIGFGRPEGRFIQDVRDDRAGQGACLFDLFDLSLDDVALFLAADKDRRAIARTLVAELAARIGRVDCVEVIVDQLLIPDF